MAALIDWFTLIFFSGCAFVVWVVWIALQTGVPRQPAANVARLAPGFEHSFSVAPFLVAIAATLAWAWLVKWRTGRHRAAIWKSLVLPAGGAALCWLLLMTLWLPLLDFARSWASLVHRTVLVVQQPPCVEALGLSRGQIAAFGFHGNLLMKPASAQGHCTWMIVDKNALTLRTVFVDRRQWKLHSTISHGADRDEDVLIYRRAPEATAP